jgi:hypothetical protein
MSTPDPNAFKLVPDMDPDQVSGYLHRQLIGCVGLLLPPVLWLVAAARHIDGLSNPLGSISAYYYSGAVAAFSGGLIAMAIFLFGYRGYKNEYGWRDIVLSFIAGIAALVAALFPTNAPSPLPNPDWWTGTMGTIHLIAGACLFGSFVLFALFQFPISQTGEAPLPRDKQIRNWIYRGCGLAILACLAWAVIEMRTQGPQGSIFWPESIALELFAATWLLKGRVDVTAVAVKDYALHPQQLAGKVQRALRPYHTKRPVL